MRIPHFALSLLALLSVTPVVTQAASVIDDYYVQLRPAFKAENAYQTVAFIEPYWRIAGNTGFNASIHHVEKILQQAGFQKEVKGEVDAPLTYRLEQRKMARPTWEPVSASLQIAGESEPLLHSLTNRNMQVVNAASTPAEGVSAELVYVGAGRAEDFQEKDVKGKIVLGDAPAAAMLKSALKAGALGVLSYSMPAYTQPQKYINSIQFQGIPYLALAGESQPWALALSYRAQQRLKAALAKGKTMVNVKIESKIYPSEELTLIANVRGTTRPDERFVFSAHVQEPGANDNATGVGTLAEMARVTAGLVQAKKLNPQRSMTFIWGDEIKSTRDYIRDDAKRAAGIKWGLSLDMVGENTAKTGGSFLIEKMPDPSAIWTRGNDKHTEWGGSVLTEAQMKPNYFTDFLLNRCRQQGKENGWVVNANPYEGGSDHQPFLDANIPGLLMWHFTDVFYHTDGDRLEMVSREEMRNVGICALAAAYTLTSADEKTGLQIITELEANAVDRLQTEFALSKKAIAQGAKKQDEQHLLEVWTNWYQAALDKSLEIAVQGATPKLQERVKQSKALLADKSKAMQAALQ
jgi:hypothetical protein